MLCHSELVSESLIGRKLIEKLKRVQLDRNENKETLKSPQTFSLVKVE